MKKLIQEILCHLEQVSPDQLLERAKADVSSGVREQQAFWGSCTESEAFKDFLHTLLLEYAGGVGTYLGVGAYLGYYGTTISMGIIMSIKAKIYLFMIGSAINVPPNMKLD